MTAREVAARVRAAFLARRVSRSLLVSLYRAYNPAVDAVAFCDAALDRFPRGACGLASLVVRHELGHGAVVRGRYGADGHTFVIVGDRIVVDVTADQFGGPPIYVGPLGAPWAAAGFSRRRWKTRILR